MTILADHSDESLMTLLQRKDLGALEALYDRHHRLALALAYRVLGDLGAAEEVVQETFLAAWRQAASYQPERGRARAWLLSIVRHRSIDRVRRSRSSDAVAQLDESILDERTPDVWQLAEQNVQREQILQALTALPREQREAIELAFYRGLTHRQISELTGLPLGTVKGRMRLGMEKLRLALADLGNGSGGDT